MWVKRCMWANTGALRAKIDVCLGGIIGNVGVIWGKYRGVWGNIQIIKRMCMVVHGHRW